MKLHEIFLICLLAFGLAAIPFKHSYAQETSAGIRGQVLDHLGKPVPGATITVLHQPSGTKYLASTTAEGRYYLVGLRIGGPYHIEAKFIGMKAEIRELSNISLGEALNLNFVLKEEGQNLSEVTVSAVKAPRTNTYGAGQNISQTQLSNMPTISRSITDITRMVPQSTKDNSFAGSNFRYNNVTIDGAINNDAIGFSPSLGGQTGTSNMPGSSTRSNPISLDAIQDMQVYLAPYDVKIGNFTGGSINAVTRSGTNEVQGSVYGYGRNAGLTGPDRTGLELEKSMPSSFHDYQAGFRIGFPILKNKLFFFANAELARRQEPSQQVAGSEAMKNILSREDAIAIQDYTLSKYGFDVGTFDLFRTSTRSDKFFSRIDWNINDRHQLVVRNNTIRSKAINMERDQADFRFGSIAYEQINNQSSTVAELKSRFNNNWSNSLVLGYTNIHDYREPQNNPSFPQVQIVGRTPGTTIFFGTDREAAVFNMKQQTFEFTDNVTLNLGRHLLTFGTHNEFYHIDYGFVNSWNGRVTYQSIADYLANKPQRVQGNYNYLNNDRQQLFNDAPAKFNINFLSAYIQDEIRISDRFRITPGLRIDYTMIPDKQQLSERTKNAITDPYLGTSFEYTPLNKITGNYLSRPQLSPRIGFRAELTADQSLILRGGLGLFTGRIPLAWLGYAYYNTGSTFGSIDLRTDGSQPVPFLPGTDPLKPNPGSPYQGIAGFAHQQGRNVSDANAGQTQIDVIDNDFLMPKVLRGSAALDFTDQQGFKYTIEGIYTKTIKDVAFRQINMRDQPVYYVYDSDPEARKQPIYGGSVDSRIANAYQLSNTSEGYRYSITGQLSRNFTNGLGFNTAYTFGRSKDISNGIRNSMESNWQLNPSLNPNSPVLANSNFDIRHRIIVSLSYRKALSKIGMSTFSLFFSGQSGSPFTYGFVNYNPQSTPQQIALAYIPSKGESVNFFAPIYATDGQTIISSPQQQADQFDQYIDGNTYLSSRRGGFTERNEGRTPWNNNLDFHFAQDINLNKTHKLTVSMDVLNLSNLISKNWGKVYFSPNTYNSTASIGLSPYLPARSSQGYPLYQFTNPGLPYAVDPFASRWQMQFGARYTF